MYQRQTLLLSALLGGVLCAPLFVFAQTSTSTAEQPSRFPQSTRAEDLQKLIDLIPTPEEIVSQSVADNLEVKTVPSTPGPNEVVRLSVQSYLIDLNKTPIIWSLDDVVMLSGIGEKVFNFKTGGSGETTKVVVSIAAPTGDVVREFLFTPVGVTLFWEADTYTPPFYKGKPLLSYEARVKAIATPDNTKGAKDALGAGNLVYTWKKKGVADARVSGYGKNSFTFTGPKPFNTTDVSVQVSSIDETVNSEAKVSLPITAPFVLFYENNVLLGPLYNRSFGKGTTLSGRELSLTAVPFFFSNEPKESTTMEYQWSTNGRSTENEGRNIVLRNNSGEIGTADVSLSIKGLRQTYQTASQSLRINFTEGPSAKPIF